MGCEEVRDTLTTLCKLVHFLKKTLLYNVDEVNEISQPLIRL